MKRLLYFPTFIFVFVQLNSAGNIESVPVCPGVIHHHEFREAGPWHIHVLEIDLTTDWIHLETVKANDNLFSHAKTSSMAASHDFEAHKVVCGINGDFYSTAYIPVGAQVIKGTLLKRPYPRSVFGYTLTKKPFIDIVSFQGQLISTDNSSFVVNGVNETRMDSALIVFNKYYGSTTATNRWGTEITVVYISGQLSVNDTILVVAIAKDSIMENGHGSNTIPSNGLVLSGHGIARTFLNEHVFVGDTLSLILQLPPVNDSIIELIGGTPRLIRNGAKGIEWQSEEVKQDFAYNRHPRTAVGFSRDSTKLYLFTVDGRQAGYSVGMSLFELADYMLEWGVYQGINLDGGGSTTMVVRGKVVNSPSDAGGERSVSNSLLVISTAPTGPLAVLKINSDDIFVPAESQLQFSVSGFDKYYNPVDVNLNSLQWSCEATIGIIDDNGLFTAGSDTTAGFVYVQKDTICDSVLVHISGIDLQPKPVILKTRGK